MANKNAKLVTTTVKKDRSSTGRLCDTSCEQKQLGSEYLRDREAWKRRCEVYELEI